ncbi:MAG: hypothetical protein CMM73_05925 [Rhodospirillaceae bacterium]|nr:hypothetical protein [Rhodospirillaceae bacterium]
MYLNFTQLQTTGAYLFSHRQTAKFSVGCAACDQQSFNQTIFVAFHAQGLALYCPVLVRGSD